MKQHLRSFGFDAQLEIFFIVLLFIKQQKIQRQLRCWQALLILTIQHSIVISAFGVVCAILDSSCSAMNTTASVSH